jgi:hypothetical protein
MASLESEIPKSTHEHAQSELAVAIAETLREGGIADPRLPDLYERVDVKLWQALFDKKAAKQKTERNRKEET